MSDNKKYYYLRLKESFFDSENIVVMESMENGVLFSNILLKLYLRSLKTDGRLMINNVIPYDVNMIAKITRHSEDVVQKALDIFEKFKLIEILENGAIYMLDIQNFIGKTTTEADRKREYDRRIAEEKEAIRNVGEISENSTPKKELEKDLELEKEKDNIISPEPDKSALNPSGILLPLNDNTIYDVPLEKIETWRKAYPAVSIEGELYKMIAWLDSNPTRRKTKRGIDKFINTWLSKEQDKGYTHKTNSFNTMQRTDYDLEELEKLIVSN